MSEPPMPGPDTQAAEVRALLKQGAVAEADARVGTWLAREARSADAWYLRGVIANLRRDHAAAIAALEQALAIRADSALAWLALGSALARADAPQKAANAYREAIAREPGWADAHFNLGVVLKRQGERAAAMRAMHAAWSRDPLMFDAAKQCVATIAECVRRGEAHPAPCSAVVVEARPSFTVVLCSIDDAKKRRAIDLYRRLFAGYDCDIVAIGNARSLAQAYNEAAAASSADVIVMSHDDVAILDPDFAPRVVASLARLDIVGVVGSTRMDGPAIGWSGHPHLRGWITHRPPGEAGWQVDVLSPGPCADGLALLDGVVMATRRAVLRAVPFDAATFDGFHLYDLDWTYRASRAGFRLGVAGELLVVHASRGRYGAQWHRHAERFCNKHAAGGAAAAPSSFFGATLDTVAEVRAFFATLRALGDEAVASA